MTTDLGREAARVLLERRLEESGLTATRFAEEVLLTNARTMRNWRNDVHPIPRVVRAWLAHPVRRPWPR